MTKVVEIDMRDLNVTPIFKYMEIENIPKSEQAGYAVIERKEVVQVQIAGKKDYSPIFPVHAFWKREGNQKITYAMRWADQYREFLEGNPQEVLGTPLQMLKPYGITPALLSMCEALKIHSIESLYALEGPAVKSLGMNANTLKDMARRYMSDRQNANEMSLEIERLRAELAAVKRTTDDLPQEKSPEEIDALIQVADDEFSAMSDDDLRDKIEEISGSKPHHKLGRDKLKMLYKEYQESAA